jgi:hypothetical protein
MVLTDAISCVDDYVSGCLHESKVVQERGKTPKTQMACYRYFSGKEQMVAKGCSLRFAFCVLRFAVCGLQVVNCRLPFLLPAVYFVVEIASMC